MRLHSLWPLRGESRSRRLQEGKSERLIGHVTGWRVKSTGKYQENRFAIKFRIKSGTSLRILLKRESAPWRRPGMGTNEEFVDTSMELCG